jgi:NAD+ kinase
MVTRIALLYHPLVEASEKLARQLVPIVEASGYEAWVESAWAKEEIVAEAGPCHLFVTFGGDGTILRVARAALESKIGMQTRHTPPLLTVDFGTLGFLTELAPKEAAEGLAQVLAGNYWIEERSLLQATLERGAEIVAERLALNDVVLARGDGPHAIRLTLFIDDAETASYTADAMIVASPTGSTAYGLAAGGPIMGPDMAGILAVPVAPHLALARSFVVPPTSRITLKASTYKTTVITLDGQVTLEYQANDLLHVTQSDAVARFVRLGPKNYFYATLQEKLQRA